MIIQPTLVIPLGHARKSGLSLSGAPPMFIIAFHIGTVYHCNEVVQKGTHNQTHIGGHDPQEKIHECFEFRENQCSHLSTISVTKSA